MIWLNDLSFIGNERMKVKLQLLYEKKNGTTNIFDSFVSILGKCTFVVPLLNLHQIDF